jgi:hypothetical protein
MPAKMLRPNVGLYVATADAFADWKNPTLTEITSATKVFNISPAVTDDYTLNQTESQSDNSLSVVDNADVTTPTYFNYEASLDAFRDANLAADSVYNKFYNLFKSPDVKYYLIKRVGKSHDAAFAAGDVVSIFGVRTDFPVDIVADGEMIRIGARFLVTGEIVLNKAVAAGTAGAGPELKSTIGTKSTSNGKIKVTWIPVANISNEGTFLSAPTAALLNGGTDLTEAIAWDSYDLGSQDSNKIEDRSILDESQVQSRGFAQYSGSLNFFRSPYNTVSLAATSGTAAAFTFILTGDQSSKLEVGMSVSGTGIGTGAKVVSWSVSTNTTVTVSIANSATVSGNITFANAQTLAYDLYKDATGTTRPTGYLAVRINKAATGAHLATDVVSIYKFTADAFMENTEGEDSVKFMVNFASQGKLGKNVTVA